MRIAGSSRAGTSADVWGDEAMHDRRVRLGLLGLILAFPPLIEAASPGADATWAASAGRVALVEALVVAGLVIANRQRRAMRAGWYEEPAPAVVEPPREVSATVPTESPRRKPLRVPGAGPSAPPMPARPAIS